MERLQVPKGWFYSENNSLVAILQAEEETLNYKLDIKRGTKDTPEDTAYIKLAETTYPTPQKLQAHDRKGKSSWYFERTWWQGEHKGYKLPYSITADAVNYYINTYISFKEHLKKQAEASTHTVLKAQERVEFTYRATVSYPDRKNSPEEKLTEAEKAVREQLLKEKKQEGEETKPAERVFVKQYFRWYYFCGQPCGWGIEMSRTVTFRGTHQITRIEGDGELTKWVSSPQTPYAPHQWITF